MDRGAWWAIVQRVAATQHMCTHEFKKWFEKQSKSFKQHKRAETDKSVFILQLLPQTSSLLIPGITLHDVLQLKRKKNNWIPGACCLEGKDQSIITPRRRGCTQHPRGLWGNYGCILVSQYRPAPLKGELPWILPPFSQCPGCFLIGGKPVKLSLEPNSSLSVNVGSVN